jgi:type IV pilus assembly protein PilC
MQFLYSARTQEGELRTGTIDARNADAAIEALQRSNLIVTAMQSAAAASPLLSRRIALFDRVKTKEIVIFSRQISTLFEAQVPIIQALRTLSEETTSVVFREVLVHVLEDVSGGAALSQALARHPRVFSRFYIALVRAGEESGKLQEVFIYLADYLERMYALTSKARSAMIYPAFVFTAFVGVIVVMLVVVIPKLTSIFSDLGQQVPFYTRLVIGSSEFLQHYGIFLLIGVILGGIGLWRYKQTDRGALVFDEIMLRIPIFGPLMKKIYLTRLTDNLATLIAAGIPIIRALEITSEVVGSRVYQGIVRDASESVKGGNTISASFDKYEHIPPLITQMIRIGEEAGKLEFILHNASGFYKRDVDNLLDNFVALIEPALIVFLGLGVGLLVAAVLVPLYNLSSAL